MSEILGISHDNSKMREKENLSQEKKKWVNEKLKKWKNTHANWLLNFMKKYKIHKRIKLHI